jgi:hypothetical protein
MGKWFDGAVEARFKSMSGGYLAKLPPRNLLGRSEWYLVNETQKTEIAAILRSRQCLGLCMAGVCIVLGAAYGLLADLLDLTRQQMRFGLPVALLAMMATGVVPILYVRHKLAPLLAMLEPTDLRVTLREQTETLARDIPRNVLVVGIVCGLTLIVANLVVLAGQAYEGRPLGAMIGNMLGAVCAGLLTAYLVRLIVLRNMRA